MDESREKVQKLTNQLSNCFDTDLKRHLEYQLKQEALKLESFELLLELSKKAGCKL